MTSSLWIKKALNTLFILTGCQYVKMVWLVSSSFVQELKYSVETCFHRWISFSHIIHNGCFFWVILVNHRSTKNPLHQPYQDRGRVIHNKNASVVTTRVPFFQPTNKILLFISFFFSMASNNNNNSVTMVSIKVTCTIQNQPYGHLVTKPTTKNEHKSLCSRGSIERAKKMNQDAAFLSGGNDVITSSGIYASFCRIVLKSHDS